MRNMHNSIIILDLLITLSLKYGALLNYNFISLQFQYGRISEEINAPQWMVCGIRYVLIILI